MTKSSSHERSIFFHIQLVKLFRIYKKVILVIDYKIDIIYSKNNSRNIVFEKYCNYDGGF